MVKLKVKVDIRVFPRYLGHFRILCQPEIYEEWQTGFLLTRFVGFIELKSFFKLFGMNKILLLIHFIGFNRFFRFVDIRLDRFFRFID